MFKLLTENSHIRQIFRYEKVKMPWPQMILAAVATVVPLLAGAYQNQLSVSIFGALCGYLISLNDHMGSLSHRLFTIVVSACILAVGFTAGFYFQNHFLLYQIFLGLVGYWLGLLGGEGAELERASVFALIAFIISGNLNLITAEIMPLLYTYSLIGILCLLIGAPLLQWLARFPNQKHALFRESIRKSLTSSYIKHIHAISLSAALVFSAWLSHSLHLEKSYWMTITVLLVMRPDRVLSIYKTLQRLIGTALGVLVADVILVSTPGTAFIFLIISLCAFSVPWALRKNYWLVAFFVTILVIMLLELMAQVHGSTHLAAVRLEATFWGCCISLLASFMAKLCDLVFVRLRGS